MFIYGGKERSLTLRKNVIRVTFLLQCLFEPFIKIVLGTDSRGAGRSF